tara:strand:+ start:533 stop:757 length:225 start_codon:yes stop_codon:yes gene_type:complete
MRIKKVVLFEDFKKMDEGTQSDLKKFIKKHKTELNDLADEDKWDDIHSMLYTEFDLEPDSNKAKDLIQTFMFIF